MTDFGKMPNYNRVEMFLHDLSFPHFKIGTIVLVLHQKYISGHFRISNSKMKYIVQKMKSKYITMIKMFLNILYSPKFEHINSHCAFELTFLSNVLKLLVVKGSNCSL